MYRHRKCFPKSIPTNACLILDPALPEGTAMLDKSGHNKRLKCQKLKTSLFWTQCWTRWTHSLIQQNSPRNHWPFGSQSIQRSLHCGSGRELQGSSAHLSQRYGQLSTGHGSPVSTPGWSSLAKKRRHLGLISMCTYIIWFFVVTWPHEQTPLKTTVVEIM